MSDFIDNIKKRPWSTGMTVAGVVIMIVSIALQSRGLLFMGLFVAAIGGALTFLRDKICNFLPNVFPFKRFLEKCDLSDAGTDRGDIDTCTLYPADHPTKAGAIDPNRTGFFSIKGEDGCHVCSGGLVLDVKAARKGLKNEVCVRPETVAPTPLNDYIDSCDNITDDVGNNISGAVRGRVGQAQGKCWKCPGGYVDRGPLTTIPVVRRDDDGNPVGPRGCVRVTPQTSVGAPDRVTGCFKYRARHLLVRKDGNRCMACERGRRLLTGPYRGECRINSDLRYGKEVANLCEVSNPGVKDKTQVVEGQAVQGDVFPFRRGTSCGYCPPGYVADESVSKRRGPKGCKLVVGTVREPTTSQLVCDGNIANFCNLDENGTPVCKADGETCPCENPDDHKCTDGTCVEAPGDCVPPETAPETFSSPVIEMFGSRFVNPFE